MHRDRHDEVRHEARARDEAEHGQPDARDEPEGGGERALVGIDVGLERSVRAWAAGDAAAAATVRAIDDARLALLEGIWARAADPSAVRAAVLVPHVVVVGALSTPSVTRDDLADVLAMLQIVATAVPRDRATDDEPGR